MLKSFLTRFARAVYKGTDRTSYLLATMSAVAILLMMLAVSADVIGRYVFDHPILGAFEFALLLMVVVVFLGLAYTQLTGQHISVDVIYMRLPRRLRTSVELFDLLALLAITAILAWRTVVHAAYSVRILEYIPGMANFPKYPSKIAMALGAVMLCTVVLVQLIRRIVSAASGDAAEGTVPEGGEAR